MAIEYDGVEVDHCVACGGVWLDEGEIALLFGDEVQTERLFHSLDAGNTELDRKLRCPISGKPMRKGRAAGTASVTFDYSPHGFWFDRGELAEVLKAGVLLPGTEHIVAWLKEVFAAEIATKPSENARG